MQEKTKVSAATPTAAAMRNRGWSVANRRLGMRTENGAPYRPSSPSWSEMQRDQHRFIQPFSMRARMRLRPFSRRMRR